MCYISETAVTHSGSEYQRLIKTPTEQTQKGIIEESDSISKHYLSRSAEEQAKTSSPLQ